MNKFLLPLVALYVVLALPAAHAQSATSNSAGAPAPADDALFRALGGQAGIDRIVDASVDNYLADDRIKAIFDESNIERLRAEFARRIGIADLLTISAR